MPCNQYGCTPNYSYGYNVPGGYPLQSGIPAGYPPGQPVGGGMQYPSPSPSFNPYASPGMPSQASGRITAYNRSSSMGSGAITPAINQTSSGSNPNPAANLQAKNLYNSDSSSAGATNVTSYNSSELKAWSPSSAADAKASMDQAIPGDQLTSFLTAAMNHINQEQNLGLSDDQIKDIVSPQTNEARTGNAGFSQGGYISFGGEGREAINGKTERQTFKLGDDFFNSYDKQSGETASGPEPAESKVAGPEEVENEDGSDNEEPLAPPASDDSSEIPTPEGNANEPVAPPASENEDGDIDEITQENLGKLQEEVDNPPPPEPRDGPEEDNLGDSQLRLV